MKKSVEERFWAKVNKIPGGCWEWAGALNKSGYGAFRYNQRTLSAHRSSFLIVNGDCGGLWVLHKCDNKKCVNPEHLFLGTPADNFADCVSKGRHCYPATKRGIEDPSAKLTDLLVTTIRERYAKGGTTIHALANEYGVSYTAVWKVLKRESWKHVP